MSEYMVIGLIVALAVAYLGYKFLGKKNRGGCGCGCSGCPGSAGTDNGARDAAGNSCCGGKPGAER